MLVIEGRQEIVAKKVKLANTVFTRLIGLMGKKYLAPDEALVIEPCAQVHTMFMRFSIDLLFLDQDNYILKTVEGLPPYRVSPKVAGARKVVELASGTISQKHIAVGEQCVIEPSSPSCHHYD